MKTATLDIDATVIACDKQAAKRAYDGNRGYQPVLALWAEQDVIVADEFRDGNVPAGSGNRRVVEKALAALPGGIAKIYLRGDSALYEHALMRWLDDKAIGYAISADMSPQLSQCIVALPENHWKLDRDETDAPERRVSQDQICWRQRGAVRRECIAKVNVPAVDAVQEQIHQ